MADDHAKQWLDTDGKPIQAHGGGILYKDGVYYWYGENKDNDNKIIVCEIYGTSWSIDRTDVIGVSCYSSKDLLHWKNEGIVLKANTEDPKHDLHFSKVLERPKVVYNENTEKYVMWMHIDSEDYQYARAGVAISESPTGPFEYLGSVRPNGYMSRDITLYKDDDSKAYIFFSSEENKTMHACLLSDDYLKPTETYTRNFIDQSREAPAVFKHAGRYYIITSACTGWDPNPAEYAEADSPLGPWKTVGNPCTGEGKETTYHSQSTFVFPVHGMDSTYIFMADGWNKLDLKNSQYVWLPMFMNGDKLEIPWIKQWNGIL